MYPQKISKKYFFSVFRCDKKRRVFLFWVKRVERGGASIYLAEKRAGYKNIYNRKREER